MTTKITIIINNPSDAVAFDTAFPEILRTAIQLPGVRGYESGKVWPKEDGEPTPAHRTFDLFFSDYDDASTAVASPHAAKFFEALSSAADGGFTGLFVDIEAGFTSALL
jgi:hypothetical protein